MTALTRRQFIAASSLAVAAGRSDTEIARIPALPAFPDYQGSPEGPLTMAHEELTAKDSSPVL
jgi:hypothetical protein